MFDNQMEIKTMDKENVTHILSTGIAGAKYGNNKICSVEKVITSLNEAVKGTLSKTYADKDGVLSKGKRDDSQYMLVNLSIKKDKKAVFAVFERENVIWILKFCGTLEELVYKINNIKDTKEEIQEEEDIERIQERSESSMHEMQKSSISSLENCTKINSDIKSYNELKIISELKEEQIFGNEKLYQEFLDKLSINSKINTPIKLSYYCKSALYRAKATGNYMGVKGDFTLIKSGFVSSDGDYYIFKLDNKGNLLQYYTASDIIISNQYAESRNLKPVIFWNSIDDLYWNAKCEDIAITFNIEHVIEERVLRFPEAMQALPNIIKMDIIKGNIARATAINAVSPGYIQPFYNFKADEIQYMIPIYLVNNISDIPDNVLIAVKENRQKEKLLITTVLTASMAYKSLISIAIYTSSTDWSKKLLELV